MCRLHSRYRGPRGSILHPVKRTGSSQAADGPESFTPVNHTGSPKDRNRSLGSDFNILSYSHLRLQTELRSISCPVNCKGLPQDTDRPWEQVFLLANSFAYSSYTNQALLWCKHIQAQHTPGQTGLWLFLICLINVAYRHTSAVQITVAKKRACTTVWDKTIKGRQSMKHFDDTLQEMLY